MTYMLARDVWAGAEHDTPPAKAADQNMAATAAPSDTSCPASTYTPAGLEFGGQRRLLESSLALLRRARHLRETGGSPTTASPRPSHRRRRRRGSPTFSPMKELASPGGRKPGDEREAADIDYDERWGGAQQQRGGKRRKIWLGSDEGWGGTAAGAGAGAGSAAAAARGAPCERKEEKGDGGGGGKGGESDDDDDDADNDNDNDADDDANADNGDGDDDDDDVLPWQGAFVTGRLCARLGRHPRMVLDNLSLALRLAKV